MICLDQDSKCAAASISFARAILTDRGLPDRQQVAFRNPQCEHHIFHWARIGLRDMARWYQVSGDARWTRTNVQSYAGYGGEDEPQSFDVGSARMDVSEIVDRWSVASHRYFKVKLRNRSFCILRHDNATHHWEMSSLTPQR